MNKWLYFALDKRDSTSYWRMLGVLTHIHHPDIQLIDISGTKVFDWSIFAGKRGIIFQRPFANEHYAIIGAAKNMGLKIILDLDDLLWDVPTWNPTHLMYKANQRSLDACFLLADEVWASTEKIKEYVLRQNKNVTIVPNALNDYMFPVERKRPFRYNKKAIWRGGASHASDVGQYEDYLIDMMNLRKDFSFTFMGDTFHRIARMTGDNCSIANGVSIIEFFRWLNNENPSAMFFPLQDNEFNRAKSNISYIEASYCGAAYFGMKDFEQFNKPGVTELTEMSESIGDEAYLKNCNEQAWEYVHENLLLSKINQIRIESILRNS
jgi:hypothetical protein